MASPPVIQDPAQAGRRAKIRIGVAVALLVTAVGILAVLNQRKSVPEPLPAETQPAMQESISSEEVEKPAEPETPVVPEPSPPTPPAGPVEPPAPPVPGKLPAATAPPPATPQTVLPAEETGMSKSARPSPPPAEPAPAKQKPAMQPLMPAPGKPVAPKEFEVQLGVFGDMENAKQLQAKLAAHGIPSHTETRVQVGPFKSREEAEQTRAKLKSLGISAVIAPQ